MIVVICLCAILLADVMAVCARIICDCDRLLCLVESAYLGCGCKVHMGLIGNNLIESAFGCGTDGVSGILSALECGWGSGPTNVVCPVHSHSQAGHGFELGECGAFILGEGDVVLYELVLLRVIGTAETPC